MAAAPRSTSRSGRCRSKTLGTLCCRQATIHTFCTRGRGRKLLLGRVFRAALGIMRRCLWAPQVPPPLGIGTVKLEDGSSVKGFICEGWVAGERRVWLARVTSAPQPECANRAACMASEAGWLGGCQPFLVAGPGNPSTRPFARRGLQGGGARRGGHLSPWQLAGLRATAAGGRQGRDLAWFCAAVLPHARQLGSFLV